jgi:hypothetical protein
MKPFWLVFGLIVGVMMGRYSISPVVSFPTRTTTVKVETAWPGTVFLRSVDGTIRPLWRSTTFGCPKEDSSQ